MNYIIGAGISGLIFAYYNKNFNLISPEVGGQFNSPGFNLGPRLLENTEETKTLLNELNISYKEEVVKIGYFNKEFFELSEKFKQEYFKQSRKNVKNFCSDESVLNSSKKELCILNFNFNDLLNKLKELLKNRIIEDKVLKINLNEKEIYLARSNDVLEFDKLVSTIPIEEFLKMAEIKSKTEHFSNEVTFVKLKESFFDTGRYGFVYCLNLPFYRISKHDGYLVAELKGRSNEEKLKRVFGDFFINYKVLNSQIITQKEEIKVKDVLFFGRYGVHNKSWKIDKTIKEAIKYARSEN